MQKHPELCTVVFMKQANRIRQGAFAAYLECLRRAGLDSVYDISLSPMRLTNSKTGQFIAFFGLDDPQKTKSISSGSPNTYIGITHFNEITDFNGNSEIDIALDSVTRGGDLSWCFQDYNPPPNANNWVNKDSLEQLPDRLIFATDYRDVPAEWIGKAMLERIRNTYKRSEREYRWRYLGEVVGVEGLVFNNITQISLGTEKPPIDMYFNGLDFGWIDPMAFVRIGYNLSYRDLYILDEIYESKLKHDDCAKRIADKGYNDILTITESAQSDQFNSTYARFGVPVAQVNKGGNLKLGGIAFLNSCSHIYIDPLITPNAWEEFNLYEWKKDREGNYTDIPIDGHDHTIDATRYALSRHIGILNAAI